MSSTTYVPGGFTAQVPNMAKVGVAAELLTEIMTAGHRFGGADRVLEVVEGLPEGARLLYVYPAPDGRTVYLVYEHESFKPLLWGDDIPELRVTLKEMHLGTQ